MATYLFTGADGKEVSVAGDPAFKAYLAEGGLEQLLAGEPLAISADDDGEGHDDEKSD